ncbi:protein kinase [Streptomyces sp. NPDC098789]|uniref:protein kinase n=1 Tax=Streptomyces sp. NPDC098789 TaxID=3366098 RepID=UPI00380BD42F
MEEYAGRILAERYRLPLPPQDASNEYELVETRAFDTRSGQEVLVRQVPLPEIVDAEMLDGHRAPAAGRRPVHELPAVRRAIAAAQAAARVPDHPRLDQVFDVFAEGNSLWIVSELVPARSLAALIADEPLSPYRAAEVAADVLTALRVLHAHGWTHRNITARTVLVCEDGRVVLTGLAAGAAEEALCGYDPVPAADPAEFPVDPGGAEGARQDAAWARGVPVPRQQPPGAVRSGPTGPTGPTGQPYGASEFGSPDLGAPSFGGRGQAPSDAPEPGAHYGYDDHLGGPGPDGDDNRGPGLGRFASEDPDPERAPSDAPEPDPGRGEAPPYAPLVAPGYDTAPLSGTLPGPRGVPTYTDHIPPDATAGRPDLKAAARAGSVAAYRAGAQAAARLTEERRGGAAPEESRPEGSNLPQGYSYPYGGPGATWHGATPRRTTTPAALPPAPDQQPAPDGPRIPDPEANPPAPSAAAPAPGPAPDAGTPPSPALAWALGPEPTPDPDPYVGAGGAEFPPPEPTWALGPEPGADPDPYSGGGDPDPAGFPDRSPEPEVLWSPYAGDEVSVAPDASRGAGAAAAPIPDRDRAPGPEFGAPEPGTAADPDRGWTPIPARTRTGDDGPRYAAAAGPEYGPPQGPGQGGSPAPGLPGRLALPQGFREAEAPAAVERAVPVAAGGWAAAVAAGPVTALDAERARLTRMAVVGAVTERWAPEQAGPVHDNWQLAAPIGPATDLWALGALLYRAVQGHAPYPEDSAAELVEMVCAEPPAFAEECGPLRPIVESLLRQDPTERPDFEELRGWLRSLVRSAPEPDGAGIGGFAFPLPEADPTRLPVVRRKGDLSHGRHRGTQHATSRPRGGRSLGRTLLLLVLVALAGGVAYAMFFLPEATTGDGDGAQARGGGKPTASASAPAPGGANTPTGTPQSKPAPQSGTPQSNTAPPASAPAGYTAEQDPEGFQILVPSGWERHGVNDMSQVRYTNGDFVLIVTPGRDAVDGNPDPLSYQRDKERELEPFRTSTWATSTGVKQTKVGQQLMAEGQYTWTDGGGRSVYVRNRAVALGGRYHVVMVIGPQDAQDKVTEVFEKATGSYRPGS